MRTRSSLAVDVDWSGWLARWHRQRQRYVPGRAERFALMADYLECARSGSDLYILDCCCGPGSLAQAMLDRFPTARVVAVDIDPWLVELGRRTITDRARVTWSETDLRRDGWAASLPAAGFDGVVSATALHWFHPDELVRLYETLAGLLAPGGLLLNADHIPQNAPTVAAWGRTAIDGWQAQRLAEPGAESWEQFWEAAPGRARVRAPAGRAGPALRQSATGARPSFRLPPRGAAHRGLPGGGRRVAPPRRFGPARHP
jgi:SAM-dependent methyltransferase